MSRAVIIMIVGIAASLGCADILHAGSEERPASAILKEYDAVHFPSFSSDATEEGHRKFAEQIRTVAQTQVDLAGELYRGYPAHSRVPEVMESRWALLSNSLERANDVLVEVKPFLGEDVAHDLRSAAYFARARAGLVLDDVDAARRIAWVKEAVEVDPDNQIGGVYLMDLAKYHLCGVDDMRHVCEFILERWPDYAWAAAPAKGLSKQLDRVGKPLPLDFEDVVTGDRIKDRELRGSPVIVMLWSGLSDTMIAELERLRELRAAHSKRGLKLVGIYTWRHSDGIEGVRRELKENSIDWPHRYVEEEMKTPWEGHLSTSEVPLYLVLDRNGMVVTVSYRIHNVEPTLHQMLGVA